MTAYDTLGNESAFSNEVFATVAGCSYSIAPATQFFTSAAGTGTISVTSGAGCNWSAQSNADWIAITAGSSGSGSGTVQYAVSANTAGDSRSGTLSIAGQTFTVSQEAKYLAYFAQFANGSQLVSSIILTNPSGTETATGLVQLLNDQGKPLYTSINGQAATDTIAFTIHPLGSASFVTDGAGDLSAGSVRVSSNVRLGGGVRYFHPKLGSAGVGESPPLRALMTVVVRDGQHGLNTGRKVHRSVLSRRRHLRFSGDAGGQVVRFRSRCRGHGDSVGLLPWRIHGTPRGGSGPAHGVIGVVLCAFCRRFGFEDLHDAGQPLERRERVRSELF